MHRTIHSPSPLRKLRQGSPCFSPKKEFKYQPDQGYFGSFMIKAQLEMPAKGRRANKDISYLVQRPAHKPQRVRGDIEEDPVKRNNFPLTMEDTQQWDNLPLL